MSALRAGSMGSADDKLFPSCLNNRQTTWQKSRRLASMDPHLPDDVRAALEEIWRGAKASEFEDENLEFKEDPSRLSGKKAKAPEAKIVEFALTEAICFANSDGGDGYIVIGVADRSRGPEAFTGTDIEPLWLQKKVFDGTLPHLHVDVAEATFRDVRLVVVRVPPGLSLYTRTNGAAYARHGTSCVPLTEDQRTAIRDRRTNPDMTALRSALAVTDLDPLAINRGRALLAQKRMAAGESPAVPEQPLPFLRELGVLTTDGELTRAAELLFGPKAAHQVRLRHLHRSVPGGEPTVTDLGGSLILIFDRAQDLVRRHGSPEIARVQLPGGQEVPVPAFPDRAVDEVVSNALVHRDWAISPPIVIDQSPRVLKVWSPGPLPHGVTVDRLLTTQSTPRNNLLMAAMRALGLAEETSRGFDRMWSAMIATGRPAPEVDADDFHVEVVIAAARPDLTFVAALARLREAFPVETIDAVSTLIVLHHLFHSPMITLHQVRTKTQTTAIEAVQSM